MTTTPAFDPSQYLSKVSGQDYLEVKWRLVWLRDKHPDAQIRTELLRIDKVPNPRADRKGQLPETERAIFRALITLPDGTAAESHGSETQADFGDHIEKAETKAIGRALAALGFGTQFCEDHAMVNPDGTPHVVDAPVKRANPNAPKCSKCDSEIQGIPSRNLSAEDYAAWTKKSFGQIFCPSCRPRNKK